MLLENFINTLTGLGTSITTCKTTSGGALSASTVSYSNDFSIYNNTGTGRYAPEAIGIALGTDDTPPLIQITK